jgi:hypothetical protein
MPRATVAFTAFVLALFFAFPSTTWAQCCCDDDCEPKCEDCDAPTTPILKGDPALFTGLLIGEKRFTELLAAETNAEDYKKRLEEKTNELARIDSEYSRKLEKATKPPPFLDDPDNRFWMGVGVGILAAALSTYGTVELLKATSQ